MDYGDISENKEKSEVAKNRLNISDENKGDFNKISQNLKKDEIVFNLQNQESLTANHFLIDIQAMHSKLHSDFPIAFFTLNEKGNILELNNAAATLLKLPITKLKDTSIYQFIADESQVSFYNHFNETVNSSGTEFCEITFIDSENQKVYTLFNSVIYSDKNLNSVLYGCLAVNITPQKLMQSKFKKTLEKNKTILDSNPDLMLIFDKSYKLVDYKGNSNNEILKFDDSNLIGKKTDELFHDNINDKFNSYIDFTLNNADSIVNRLEFTINDGNNYYEARFVLCGTDEVLVIIRNISALVEIKQKLISNIQRQEFISENMTDLVALTDDKGNYKFVTKSYELLGYSSDYFIGRHCLELVHPDDFPMIMNEFNKGLKNNISQQTVEFRIRCANEEYKWLETTGKTIFSNDGTIKELLFCSHDITERKKNELIIQQNKVYLESIFDAVNDAIFVDDADTGLILDVNQGMLDMYGYSYNEVLKLEIGELSASELGYNQEKALEWLRKTREQGPQQFEWIAKHKDGHTFWVEVKIKFVIISGLNRFLVIVRDISERKLNEIELMIKDRAISSSLYAIAFADLEGKLTYVNPAFLKLWGSSSDSEVIGKPIIEFWNEPDNKAEVINALKKNGFWNGEIICKTKDNGLLNIDVSASLVMDDQGMPICIQAAFVDITERISTRKMIIEAEQRLRSLINSTPDIICFKDGEGRWLEANNAYLELFSINPNDYIGKHNSELMKTIQPIYSEILAKGIESDEMAWRYGVVSRFELPVQNEKGNNRIFDIMKIPIFDELGLRKGLVVLGRDITEIKQIESHLRINEERFRRFSNLISDVVYSCRKFKDGNYSIDWIAGATDKIFGASNELVKAKKCWKSFVDDEYVPVFLENILKLEPGNTSHCELLVKNIKGNLVWIDTYSECVEYDDNKQVLYGVLVDITERKENEKALKESEKRYDLTLSAINDGIWDWDIFNDKIFFDDRYYTLAGYEPNEFPANYHEWIIRVHPEDREFTEKAIKDHLDGKSTILMIEFRFLTKARTYIWIRSLGRIVEFDSNNKPSRFIGTHSDISKQKVTELALIESEKRFKNYINSTSDIVFTLDKNRNHTGVFGEWYKKFGLSESDFIGKKVEEILPGTKEIHIESALNALKGENVVYEWEAKSEESINYFQTSLTPLIENNEIVGVIGVGRDISEIKNYSISLNKLNIDKDKFFSILAHDLRNPLGSFRGYIRLLFDSYDTFDVEEKKSLFKTIKDSSENIYNLLENLLEWSRSQRGKLPFNPNEVFMWDLCNMVIKVMEISATLKNIHIINKINPITTVWADTNMINMILRNLITNAIKFSFQDSIVEIGTIDSNDKSFKIIYVKDYGVGMSKEKLDSLFKIELFISTPGTSGEKGTGLGLLLCKEFVEKHSGRIWAESTLQRGSTFYFSLPIEQFNEK